MLQRRSANLHPPRAADPGMRDVTITADLVRGVDDDHPLLHLIGQHAGALAQHRRPADARATQQQDALSADDHVLDDVDRAVMARPTRQVTPTIWPPRLRITEMRWSVRSMPARLLSPNDPTRLETNSRSSEVTGVSSRITSWSGKRASGSRPRSSTTSSSRPW